MKSNTINHIKELFKNITPKADAAGNYYEYPLQSLFLITHGGVNCGHVDLAVSKRFILTKGDFTVDKTYPSISMKNSIGNQFRYKFTVNIKEPKDFKKTTGVSFKDIITGTETKVFEKVISTSIYKGEYSFMFNSFEDANEFYLYMTDKLNLKEDTYKNDRYLQMLNGNAPEFTKDVYLDLISNFKVS